MRVQIRLGVTPDLGTSSLAAAAVPDFATLAGRARAGVVEQGHGCHGYPSTIGPWRKTSSVPSRMRASVLGAPPGVTPPSSR